MIDLKDKHIVVAGAARSGIGAALLLKKKGAIPFVSDSGSIGQNAMDRLRNESIRFEENQHSADALKGDFLVLSPGVPSTASIVQHYIKENRKVISEVELASWFNKSDIVAVTGSNGKTTVVNWLAHTWDQANREYILAGNIGTAFSELVEHSTTTKTALLEISSFQLDHIESFKPKMSVLLNITEDHLDRYQQDFSLYIHSKFKITQNQTATDWFIYNFDDPIISAHASELAKKSNAPKLLAFSSENEVPNGAFIRNGELILKLNNEEEHLMQIGEIGLSGKHNLQNGMATALAARAAEIKNEFIRESLRSFEGVTHRLELVREYKGVRYYNDSKATNVNAVWYALSSFNTPMVLILGGRDKGSDFKLLEHQIRDKVHTIVAIGEAKDKIKNELGKSVPNLIEATSMKDAVKKSKKVAKRGEIVLLSPACSSFDMFENYEHRGNEFKQAVLDL
ncbi:MAG: UDP-N-acetylmuramoyl-L-alanine--D-glutamate ligase [Balneolaceae bacterium]